VQSCTLGVELQQRAIGKEPVMKESGANVGAGVDVITVRRHWSDWRTATYRGVAGLHWRDVSGGVRAPLPATWLVSRQAQAASAGLRTDSVKVEIHTISGFFAGNTGVIPPEATIHPQQRPARHYLKRGSLPSGGSERNAENHPVNNPCKRRPAPARELARLRTTLEGADQLNLNNSQAPSRPLE